ncbi:NepR family anti-sigma factor [Roseovarius sp. M141]|uniref:NepR family anti-sigma factor n=1 Tax=Roseovarius sp. M141 TaxID=2583806 RepID=UPI0020CC3D30|nr:NepR family anti-sigma factor [Roseovarius sp. M141]
MTTGKGDGDESGRNAPQGQPKQGQPKRNQIDDNLRRVYDDMLDDSVPDRFQDLLRQLREQDSEK